MFSTVRQLLARALRVAPSDQRVEADPDLAWLNPPADPGDVSGWDRYWLEQVNHGMHPGMFDMLTDDRDLVRTMKAEGFRRVLCAGNGISQEPWWFAVGGCAVVALDLSPQATRLAQQVELPAEVHDALERTKGRVDFVTGDLLDSGLCPGPFDVVIERRTAQLFAPDVSGVMKALAGRLSGNGIFVSHSHDGRWKPPARPRHFTRAWFVENGWTIWDGHPGPKPPGQVAWLVTTTG